MIAIIVVPLGKNVLEIAMPGPSAAEAMATYLNENVPKDAIIETWEPEMGFLTDHNYHFPPNKLLQVAIEQVYANGTPVQNEYNFVQTEHPEYLLLGEFSLWVNMYPMDQLMNQYELVNRVNNYELYKRIN